MGLAPQISLSTNSLKLLVSLKKSVEELLFIVERDLGEQEQ